MKNNLKEVSLEFNLPGFEKKDIKIKVSKNAVSVNAEKKQESKIQKKDFFHHERSYQAFSYATTLPDVKPEKAKVKFNKGKLQIILPKKKK